MPKLAPFRRVLLFAECTDIDVRDGTRRRVVRMKLECHHVIFRHDRHAQAGELQVCEDCGAGKKPQGISKAAFARWRLR